jgi:hypothetical protein
MNFTPITLKHPLKVPHPKLEFKRPSIKIQLKQNYTPLVTSRPLNNKESTPIKTLSYPSQEEIKIVEQTMETEFKAFLKNADDYLETTSP